MKGGCAIFKTICVKGHVRVWVNQPYLGKMPAGNLETASAILFAGCSPTKVLNFLKHANIASMSIRTYFNLQRSYAVPAINHLWNKTQTKHFEMLRNSGEEVDIGGDARCDSPGHSAKYATYSIMDLNSKKVLHSELIQCNETTSSNAMELEGAKRCMDKIIGEGIPIRSFTTDRHPSIRKWMREAFPHIRHFFDCWHIAKTVYKQLIALAKKKGNELIRRWARSISNHLYWCAKTSDGKADAVQAKWASITNHITNVHEGRLNIPYDN